MMPIWSGLAPALSSFVVIFSTLAASVLQSYTPHRRSAQPRGSRFPGEFGVGVEGATPGLTG